MWGKFGIKDVRLPSEIEKRCQGIIKAPPTLASRAHSSPARTGIMVLFNIVRNDFQLTSPLILFMRVQKA